VIASIARIVRLGLVVAAVGTVATLLPPVQELEEAIGLGWLFTARGPIEPPADVAVVALSSETAEALGVSRDVDEWPRTLHAELIDRLQNAGASVIAFDIIFEARRDDDPEGDIRLAEAIAGAGNVVLAERVTEIEHRGLIGERRILPIEAFRDGALATAPFILPLYPARVGQAWTFGRADGTPSLPAVTLHAYALPQHGRLLTLLIESRPALVSELGEIGLDAVARDGLQEVMRRLRSLFLADPSLGMDLERRLADWPESRENRALRALVALYAGGNGRYLRFYGPAGTIDTIPYHDVLDADPETLRRRLADRAVFVGYSEKRRSEQQDFFDSVFSERSGQRLSGVEIGATAFANLLHREPVRPLPWLEGWVLIGLWGALVAAVSLSLRGFAAAGAAGAAAAVFAAAALYAFEAHGIWAPLVIPLGLQLPIALVAGLSWNHVVLRRQRERIRSALEYYVPAEVVDRLAAKASPRASRDVFYGTCLVTDAEQYTTLSESVSPAELGELMDAYFDVLVEVVHRHGGVVSDIGGDSMIAVWPTTRSADAARAAASRAALDVLAGVDEFNDARAFEVLPTRIGIDSGQLLLGNVGASGRGEYRAVGDIVNTAARLQGLNRLLGTKVLLSAFAVPETSGLDYRPLGEFLLVGKRTPISVLELRSSGEGAKTTFELDEAFADALALFRRGEWRAAESAFLRIVERFPADGPARFYAAECKRLGERFPNGAGWDGVVQVTVK